jgi:hypothetical protein
MSLLVVVFAPSATERQAGGGQSHRHTLAEETGVTHCRQTTHWLSCMAIHRFSNKHNVHEKLLQTGHAQIPGARSPDHYILHGGPRYLWVHSVGLVSYYSLLPRNLRWLLHLWIICALLLQNILKSYITSRLHNLMHRFVFKILRPFIPHTKKTRINRCGNIVCICASNCRINRCGIIVYICAPNCTSY